MHIHDAARGGSWWGLYGTWSFVSTIRELEEEFQNPSLLFWVDADRLSLLFSTGIICLRLLFTWGLVLKRTATQAPPECVPQLNRKCCLTSRCHCSNQGISGARFFAPQECDRDNLKFCQKRISSDDTPCELYCPYKTMSQRYFLVPGHCTVDAYQKDISRGNSYCVEMLMISIANNLGIKLKKNKTRQKAAHRIEEYLLWKATQCKETQRRRQMYHRASKKN